MRRDYGFNVFTASPTQEDIEVYMKIKQRLNRPELPFKPFVDICFERKLSKHTYLIIEGLCIKNIKGVFLNYSYSFYKASYFDSEEPQRIKVYGDHLERKELLRKLKKFHFLKKQQ